MNRQKIKKYTLSFFAIVCIVLLSIAITVAYLKDRTEEESNTFTMGKGVTVELTEPRYDKDDKKNNFTYGTVINKDPTVSITDKGMEEEYVAIRVTYHVDLNGDGKFDGENETLSYKDFCSTYATIQSYPSPLTSLNVSDAIKDNKELGALAEGCHVDWVSVDHNQTFLYGSKNTSNKITLTKLKKGEKATVFDKVVINNNKNALKYPVYQEDTLMCKKGQLVGFQIVIQAYAVDGTLSNDEAIKAFQELGFNIE